MLAHVFIAHRVGMWIRTWVWVSLWVWVYVCVLASLFFHRASLSSSFSCSLSCKLISISLSMLQQCMCTMWSCCCVFYCAMFNVCMWVCCVCFVCLPLSHINSYSKPQQRQRPRQQTLTTIIFFRFNIYFHTENSLFSARLMSVYHFDFSHSHFSPALEVSTVLANFWRRYFFSHTTHARTEYRVTE